MSLLKFLTAGKSLVGGRESTGRYQVTDPRALPKFESRNKSPFRDTVRANRIEAPGKAPDGAAASGVRLTAKARGASWRTKLSALTARLPWGRSVKSVEPGAGIKGRFFRQREKTTAIPRFRAAMVQSELSLEGVRVVRNDLSDSDLEIISAKNPAVAVSATKANPGAEKPARAAAGRNRLNIFGASKL